MVPNIGPTEFALCAVVVGVIGLVLVLVYRTRRSRSRLSRKPGTQDSGRGQIDRSEAADRVDMAELDLRRQLAEDRENLRLVRERKSQYVIETDIPLQLIKAERSLLERIREKEQRIAKLKSSTTVS